LKTAEGTMPYDEDLAVRIRQVPQSAAVAPLIV